MEREHEQNERLRELIPAFKQAARRLMKGERRGHTLQTTALMNEAYVRIAKQTHDVDPGSPQFRALMTIAMRNALFDHAKSKHRLKRGGEHARLPFEAATAFLTVERQVDILEFEEAVEDLRRTGKEGAARIVGYFAYGLTYQEIASVERVTVRQVEEELRYARAHILSFLSARWSREAP